MRETQPFLRAFYHGRFRAQLPCFLWNQRDNKKINTRIDVTGWTDIWKDTIKTPTLSCIMIKKHFRNWEWTNITVRLFYAGFLFSVQILRQRRDEKDMVSVLHHRIIWPWRHATIEWQPSPGLFLKSYATNDISWHTRHPQTKKKPLSITTVAHTI